MMASASAVTLRGAPQCHGENVASTVRPRSTSESGIMLFSPVTSSCTASSPRRSASIAEREPVATGTRVGDRDAAARRGMKTVCGHAQWQDSPHGRCTQGCPQPRGEAPQGARLSGESIGSAADPDARSAREDESSVQRPASYGPRKAKSASTGDRLTLSRVSLACRGWRTPAALRLTVSQVTTRCSA
ncbi:hypothetical protein TcBrA4_0110540 [Trypanosoma cruzi]|nr:hypothetical protein TcBrA4_0110540 [Trypanosoma cruzi]